MGIEFINNQEDQTLCRSVVNNKHYIYESQAFRYQSPIAAQLLKSRDNFSSCEASL